MATHTATQTCDCNVIYILWKIDWMPTIYLDQHLWHFT